VEEGLSFNGVEIGELSRVGSLCKMSTTPQSLLNNTRYLVTLEGRDKIRILREAPDAEFLEYIERAKEDKLKDLKERVDNLATLRLHNQSSDTTVENLRA
jgi:Lon protease-like protein